MKVKHLNAKEGERIGISNHPNFSTTGNIKGMKSCYGEDALFVKCGSYIYSVTKKIYHMAS